MAEQSVLIDFDPWSEVSHHAHLAHKSVCALERGQEDQTRAIERQTREIAHSRSAVTNGLLGLNNTILENLAPVQARLTQVRDSIENWGQATQQGLLQVARAQRQTAEAIAWGFGGLSRGNFDLKSEMWGGV